MADPFVGEEPNPFQGVSVGRGVDMLLRDESLAQKFDEYYDRKQVETLRRMSLHQTNAFYRDSPTGAATLRAMQELVTNPPQAQEVEATPAQEARDAWAQRLARGVKRGQEFKPYSTKEEIKKVKTEYDRILNDLAEYDLMTPASGFWEHSAALGGAISGSLLSVENVAAFPLRGTTTLARIAWGGLQNASINLIADPLAQVISMNTEIRKEFSAMQTALSVGMGAAIGGGLVGLGEVLTRGDIWRGVLGMKEFDPQVEVRNLVEPPPGQRTLDEAMRLAKARDEAVPEEEPVVRAEPEAVATRREPTPPPAPDPEPTIREQPDTEATAFTPVRSDPPPPADPIIPEWEQIGPQKGSNPGGLYKDSAGIQWYLKTPLEEGQTRAEVISNQFYYLTNISVPEAKFVTLDGNFGLGSKFLPSVYKPLGQLAPDSQAYGAAIEQIREGFAVDAWLANWDVIGLAQDNILVRQIGDGTVSIARVDQGGTLNYRAQGGLKKFEDDVPEFYSLRDPSKAKEAAPIFKDMTDEELIKSISRVAAISENQIDHVVKKFGPTDVMQNAYLRSTLKNRREYLIDIAEELKAKPKNFIATDLLTDENSRWMRAKIMGFKVTESEIGGIWLHGTKGDFLDKGFDIAKSKTEDAVFLTKREDIAYNFGSQKSGSKSVKVLKLFHRANKIMIVETEDSPSGGATFQAYNSYFFNQKIKEARAQKYDAVLFKNVSDSGGIADQLAILKPSQLRSVDALFDPKKKLSKKLLAMEDGGSFKQQYEDLIRQSTDDELRLERLQKEQLAIEGPLQGELLPQPNYERPPEIVQSLQQMADKLVERFGVAIRQRRTPEGTQGVYGVQTGVIAVREFANFQVDAHEVAHQIAARMTGDAVNLSGSRPLANLANGVTESVELAGLDYNPNLARVGEGFAEYIRLFMTNPNEAATRAPAFHSGFVNLLEREDPAMLQDLLGFQEAFRNYNQALPTQKLRATIVTPRDTRISKAISWLAGAKVAPTVGNVLNLLPEVFTNSDHAVSVVTRELGKAIKRYTGQLVDLLPSQNPIELMRMYRKFTQIAMAQARDGVINWGDTKGQGPTLRQVLARAFNSNYLYGLWNEEIFEEFGAYLKARMVAVRWQQVRAGKLNRPPTAETEQEILEAIADLERRHPYFKEAGELFTDFNRRYLRRKTDSGAFFGLDDTTHNRIVDSSPDFFAPLRRDVKDLMRGTGSKGTDLPQPGAHEFVGSIRDVIHPVIAVLNDLTQSEAQMAHAQLARAFRDLARAAGFEGGRFVEELPAHEVKKIEFDLQDAFSKALVDTGIAPSKAEADLVFENIFSTDNITGTTFKMVPINGKREPVIFWTDGGKLQAARFIRKGEHNLALGLYEIMQNAPKPAMDVAVQVAGIVSHTFTAGITTHWAYILRNIFRDQFAAAFYVPGYIPYYHAIKGAVSLVTNDEAAQAYRRFGGVNPAGQFHPAFAEAVEADIKALQSQGFTIRKATSLRGIAEVLSTGEMATRLGATGVLYRQKKKQGLSDYDAWMSAVNESSDTLPFDRVGSGVVGARQIIPFLGAWIQSMSKLSRRTLTPTKQAIHHMLGAENGFVFTSDVENAYKGLVGMTGAVIGGIGFGMMYAAAQWSKAGYVDAKDKVKATNFIIPLENGDVWLLPKPWELSLGFTLGEMMYAGLVQNDPRAAAQFGVAVKESFASPNFIFGNPVVGVTSDVRANYNSFTGGPIVSEQLLKKDPYLQYDFSTSGLAKALGRITNWSPKKIDYVLSGFFPYYGRDLQLMSQGTDDGDATSVLMNMTLTRLGIRDPLGLSDAPEKFWEHMGKTTGLYNRAANSYRSLLQNPQTRWEAQEYFNKLPPNLKAWVTLLESGAADGKQTFSPEARAAHPLEHGRRGAAIANAMRKAVLGNTVLDQWNKNNIVVNPELRQKVAKYLGQIALAEYSNALIMMGEPGYAGRTLTEPQTYLAQIRNIAPNIAEELIKRYATEKVYRTEDVAKAYPRMREALLQFGSRANLGPLTAPMQNKYEFGGFRKPGTPRPYRQQIGGSNVQTRQNQQYQPQGGSPGLGEGGEEGDTAE